MSETTSLWDRRLILVGGKGGVGRTTVAAAIAHECARRGRRTLLLQANAADRVGGYFGRPPVGVDLVELAPKLWAINTTPAAALAEYGLMVLKFGAVYDMVFENRITKAFLRAVPGIDDYAVLGKVWFHTTETERGKPRWDTVVFDMPASGHSLSMLRIPQVITETVPEGPLTRDARAVLALLRDPTRCATVLVTLAEEMPVNEVRELSAKLAALGVPTQQVVANQIYPDRFPPGSIPARVLDALDAPADPTLAALATHARLAAARATLARTYLGELRAWTPAPLTTLPMIFADELGPADVARLGGALAASVDAAA
ncbi:MAG: ArsA family ATPase [Kofleriaceae bacterium]